MTAPELGFRSSPDAQPVLIQTGAPTAPAGPGGQRADVVVRRLLRIPEGSPPVSAAQAQRSFSVAMVISGLRCLISYVVVPVLLPVLGLAVSAAPLIGAPIAALALVFDVRGIRRFWLSRSPRRWAMTWIYLAVMGLIFFLLVHDLIAIAR